MKVLQNKNSRNLYRTAQTRLFITVAATLLLAAPAARAQTTDLLPRGFDYANTTFVITYNGQAFSVDNKTLAAWQGETAWPDSSSLTWQSPPLPDELMTAFGRPIKPASAGTTIFHYRVDKIYGYLQTLSAGINQPAVEPNLSILDNRVTAFTPPQTGLSVDVFQTALNTAAALELGATSTPLVVNALPPTKNLAGTNNLGINKLIAEGTSGFKGSPNNRRHNIATGIDKFKGLLIAPGAEFSFDDNLGPVTAEAGFLPELVIDNGTTLPELGGGLCQVSTTAFRAAMAAGLPITARRNHAYAVSYYSPQGTDATIYPGSADLKFINNTPGDILVWPYEKDANTLVFDFYGTKDDRQVTLEKPVVYDRLPDGSMKATWTRIVTLAGETSTSTFKSTYQPPALFHKTETFVSATGTESSGLKIPVKTQ